MCQCCRYYYQGECVQSCPPDGYFKSTLLLGSSRTTESADGAAPLKSSVDDYEELPVPAPQSAAAVDRLTERQCLPCHVTCASCVGQLSTDCVQCRQPLLWSNGRCLHTCDYLYVLLY